ncbi:MULTISPECIES: 2-oxo-4-hydroxy-4-carboxy-5-ureidoimidazoline decarboxylase [Gordonia]|uniref:2-oxo-4-hydroxy-4-carboxy-5-ureidoimidazoline decarboxylase n=1 Tax=Gordonia amicalis TaxID=89053 RepID=A0AAE4R5Q6_9ACTN|nr:MULTISPECIES: 2-oxo-4-hydroxy-4-carboxy-5-ureidoimidazoline decarboxylase [Gordonia]KAF0968756.1 Uric acid degradation bifunctional protein [Gordonia sp. YY1]MCR8898012.1 2-oxo-4-hydroxy-4-carboxy-5-ureidoimidazoline decarboxylase [Gordonia sp. GONU]MCZ4578028.1 2-oxo-4-hydroxy-4-carboxy-5-ureidoimidazoline decarboxylase [Gordonia amicalis]MDV6310825.1 2-oxo-4-hydroxy-4-carboxy-5-ureidoimidazoline decarboxylase [Gordonia amicalis]
MRPDDRRDAADEGDVRRFNELSVDACVERLLACCSSPTWARRVATARPFVDAQALLDRADQILTELTETDIDEALAGHPRIGDRPDNASSAREQSGVAGADPSVLAELEEFNAAYEQRFGHVYLVFANGRPAHELLGILKKRIDNDAETERRVMRAELAKINRSRLIRMLATHDTDEGASA